MDLGLRLGLGFKLVKGYFSARVEVRVRVRVRVRVEVWVRVRVRIRRCFGFELEFGLWFGLDLG